jgi:hypothetical protein
MPCSTGNRERWKEAEQFRDGPEKFDFAPNDEVESLRPFVDEFWSRILETSYSTSFVSNESNLNPWQHYVGGGRIMRSKTRRFPSALLVACALLACGSGDRIGGSASPAISRARAVERAILDESPRAERVDDTLLVIKLRDGEALELKDVLSNSYSEAIRYSYRTWIDEIASHVVQYQLYEGHGYLLVNDATGLKTPIQGVPVVSPDRERFATGSMDLEAGYNPNEVQIWLLTPAGPRLEWSLSPRWGPARLSWASSREVRILKQRYLEEPSGEAVVQFVDGGWELGADHK